MTTELLRTISFLAPGPFGRYLYERMANPQIRRTRTYEAAVLDRSTKETVIFGNYKIVTYRWHGGNKCVLLIHGWEGQAGNFAELTDALLDAGYTVLAFDAPSHGRSSRGPTSPFEFAEVVGLMVKKYAAQYLVSHSFGSVATTFALSQDPDLKIAKIVFLTTPDQFTERVDDFIQKFRLSGRIRSIVLDEIRRHTSHDITKLAVSDLLKSVRVDSILIVHGADDSVIPISRSRNVHLSRPGSRFLEIKGTGHFAILRAKETWNAVIEFLGPLD